MAEFKNRRTGFKVNNTADNIDLTNTATTADVEEVADDLETLEGTVTTLDGNVEDVADDLETLEGTVETLSGNVTTLEGTVETLSGNVTTLGNSVLKVEKSEYVQAGTYTCTIPDTKVQNIIFEIEYTGYNSTWTGFIYGKSVFGLPLVSLAQTFEVYDIVSNEGINISATLESAGYVITIDSLPAAAYITIKSNQ